MSGEAPQQLSNWGRWDADDERGALNLLTPEMVKQAASLVKRGKVYSLSMPFKAEGPQWPQRHKTCRVTTFRNPPNEQGSANDVVTMHSHSGTHMDALCHIWYNDQLYNGYRASDHVTSSATRNGIHDVVAVCADNHAVEAFDTMSPPRLPIHAAAIRDLGIYLVEYLNLEELAANKVYECLLVIAPLQLTGAIGRPVNPLAFT